MARTAEPPRPGDTFGRWTVTGPPHMTSSGHRAVPCRCDCGAERDVLVFALRSGKSSSCGCWKREDLAARKPATTHGYAAGRKDALYRLWQRMNRRCHSPMTHNYKYYGGRGIAVWEPWRHDAGAFIDWVEQNLGPCPDGKSLDRIDNDGGYAPGNLRWATKSEQALNRRVRI